ncbi:acyl-CoA-binding protein [Pilobolus umbonatus]|nr:acyl-CoA-binding protein [Pilobolus umbonatus]
MPSEAFETAAKEVKELTSKPSNEELLQLYAYFKQATVGDNTTSKPTFSFEGRYKWDAWTGVKGTSQEEAEQKYIALVEALKAKQ